MDRTNGAGHVNHLFVAENAATNQPPTEVTADWLNGLQEELIAILLAAGIVPDKTNLTQVLTALQSIFLAKNGTSALLQNFAGLTRSMTPLGGGLIREYVDVTNAATVGGIEIGVVYNCSINTATGVWAGRDIADICWLEKWHDVAGTKEFWFAPTGVANAVPVWTKIFAIDMVNGTVTLPTPAKFDNTTKAATTAFVQGALGSLSGFLTLNANVTLTAAHAGRGCYFSAAAIATLPLANTVTAGTLIYFTSATTGATSVARQSTDSIAASSGSSALSSMVLLDGEDLLLESNGNNQWIAVGGSARLKFAGAFGASITSNGYQKLPGGLILQWGTAACAAGSTVVTFPLAFSVAPFIHGYMNNQTSTSGATTVSVSASTTGMSLASSVAAMSGSWFAIGK